MYYSLTVISFATKENCCVSFPLFTMSVRKENTSFVNGDEDFKK